MIMPMRKLSILILTIFASLAFTPVTFFFATQLGVNIVCRFSGCVRGLSGPAFDSYFHVMVSAPGASGAVVDAVRLTDLPTYRTLHPGSSLSLTQPDGESADHAWRFSASTERNVDGQSVAAHFIDDAAIEARYVVVGDTVRPTYLEVRSIGIMFHAAPFALLAAILLRWLSRRLLARRTAASVAA